MTRWRVHVGAPKTGTTHLQALLAHHGDALAAQAVEILERAAVRPLVNEVRSSRRKSRISRLREMLRLTPSPTARLARLRKGAPTAVFSEEGLLGTANGLIDTRYFRGLTGPSLLDRLPDRQSLDLFLSIRSQDATLSAAYAVRNGVYQDGLRAIASAGDVRLLRPAAPP